MRNIKKISIIGGVVVFLLLFGVSQYKYIKVKASPIYMTTHKSKTGVMVLGGMASDKDKIDSFKKSLEEDKYSNYLDEAYSYKKQGDYQNAIIQAKKALELAKSINEHWMVRTELAELYEKVGKYDLALEQYDVITPIQEEALDDSTKKGYKLDVVRRKKLINELKESRKRVEDLKAKSETK